MGLQRGDRGTRKTQFSGLPLRPTYSWILTIYLGSSDVFLSCHQSSRIW